MMQIAQSLRAGRAQRLHESQDHLSLLSGQTRTLGKIATVIFATRAKQRPHALQPQTIQLVDRSQDDAALLGKFFPIQRIQNSSHFHHTIEHFAIVHPDNVIATGNAHFFQSVRQHCANFRICSHACRSNSIRITLIKLTEPTRAGFFIAPNRPHGKAAIGAGKLIAVLGIDARKRRCQIIAQRQPVVILLPSKDAFIWAIHIRQKFAQGLNGFNSAAFQLLKSVEVIHIRNAPQHLGPL